MKRIIFSLFVFALVGTPQTNAPSVPFSVSVVPESCYGEVCYITVGHSKPANARPPEFYVVLTNNSQQPQPVYEYWNSWGYQTISFQLTTAEGKRYAMSKRPQDFDHNYPSTFLIKPGEHQVFTIRFDDDWETIPTLQWKDKIQVTLKAAYEVSSKDETYGVSGFPLTAKEKVWKGRIESAAYDITLPQR